MALRSAVHTRAAGARPDALWDMERSLRRRGFAVVAGADEAGRGACAGPLVAAACVLPSGRRGRVPGLADSKLLTAAARERVYAEVVDRALSWSVVGIPVGELDARGRHVTNLEAPRRAVSARDPCPAHGLTDGVPGLADSTLLPAAARERVYAEVVDRALSWSVVVIPVGELDARGMHVTNLEALRRAVSALDPCPDYVLTVGFPVPGLTRPGLA